MLKSIVHEIIGTPRREPELPQSLEQFRDRKRVLIIFADAQDDRALIQDEWLRKAHMRLIEEDVEGRGSGKGARENGGPVRLRKPCHAEISIKAQMALTVSAG